MKIRQGFVSNSSSSSFLIYGVEVDTQELIEKLKLTKEELEQIEEEGSWYLQEIFPEDSGLEIEFAGYDYDDECYIGRSWGTVGDEETGKEFKEDVEKKVSKILGEETECGSISHAWYG